jgi:hypothetical protein
MGHFLFLKALPRGPTGHDPKVLRQEPAISPRILPLKSIASDVRIFQKPDKIYHAS